VISFGTPGLRWSATLQNLKADRKGLAHDPHLANLPADPYRLIAIHVPLSRLVAETPSGHWTAAETAGERPSSALTAVGISASAETLGVDLHVPPDELRVILRKRGLIW
jgi:hypothetical protein